LTKATAEIARAANRSWLALLIDTACDQFSFILQSLFDLAMEHNRNKDSQFAKRISNKILVELKFLHQIIFGRLQM